MEWTPEAVKAQMDYRIETARKYHTAKQVLRTRTRHPSWWRRLRTQH